MQKVVTIDTNEEGYTPAEVWIDGSQIVINTNVSEDLTYWSRREIIGLINALSDALDDLGVEP